MDPHRISQDYYDSDDAFNFYDRCWGGEHIHVGLHDMLEENGQRQSPHERVRASAKLATEHLLGKTAGKLNSSSWMCDMGSAYGGTARYAASKFGCRVLCVDLSTKENERNRRETAAAGLEDKVLVPKELSFLNTEAEADTFDLVVSQDSLLHAGRERHKAIKEASRILKPGGHLVFSDIMQQNHTKIEDLRSTGVLQRIHLEDMSTPAAYVQHAEEHGLSLVEFEDRSDNLKWHYTAVREILESERPSLQCISPEYIDNMIAGLNAWVDAGEKGLLCWGYFVFVKK